jgi:hypothetical protein
MTTDIVSVAGVASGILSLTMVWRQRSAQHRDARRLQEETNRAREECLCEIRRLGVEMAESESKAKTSLELLGDGRMAMPARARALQMLRSGMAAETTATELGLARNDVRLLAKVAGILAQRN